MTRVEHEFVGTVSRIAFEAFAEEYPGESSTVSYGLLEKLCAEERHAEEAVPTLSLVEPILREIARNAWQDTEISPSEFSFYLQFYQITAYLERRVVDWDLYSTEHAFEEFCFDAALDTHPCP